MNFDSTKTRAQRYLVQYELDEVKVIDNTTGKNYGIQKKTKVETKKRN